MAGVSASHRLNPWSGDPEVEPPDDGGRTQALADAITVEEVRRVAAKYRVRKHASPIHPGTGTGQEVHGGSDEKWARATVLRKESDESPGIKRVKDERPTTGRPNRPGYTGNRYQYMVTWGDRTLTVNTLARAEGAARDWVKQKEMQAAEIVRRERVEAKHAELEALKDDPVASRLYLIQEEKKRALGEIPDWDPNRDRKVREVEERFARLEEQVRSKFQTRKSLSPSFGKPDRRRRRLIRRLKRRRSYARPVKGGTGKQNRTRRSRF